MSLSPKTLQLARQAIDGVHRRAMAPADFTLEDCGNLDGLPSDLQYGRVVVEIARRAPLRIVPGERIVGAATLSEALSHQVPVLGIRSTSHTTPDFRRVLSRGYRGLRAQVQERLERGDLPESGVDFLQGARLCLEAADIWRCRHEEFLESRVQHSAGPERNIYAEALEIVRRVPEHPARTFHEALQSLWFAFAFQRLCGNWPGIGRIDLLLGPYLESDLAAGRIDLDGARELLAHFWIRGAEWAGHTPADGSGDGQFYQNIVLGGVDVHGREAANPVTELVLDVVEELHISDFPVSVRLSSRTPDALLRRIARVQRRGGGIVAVYNEDRVMDAMHRFGYDEREARQFANDGCWEVLVPGETCFGYRNIDLLMALQETLGVVADGPAPHFDSFDALYEAFHDNMARKVAAFHNDADRVATGGLSAPLLSLLVDDCVERARGYHDRGPRYTVFSPHGAGLPDTANALQAIHEVVYQNREMPLPALVDILRNNWDGYDDLRNRMRARGAFFGNDHPETDALAQRIFDDFVAEVEKVRERNGVLRPAGLSTFGRQIEWADARGATAAGTRRGDVLSNNFSPAPGTDRLGPTAVLKSCCSVDFERLPCGTALDLKINPDALQGETGLQALAGLMRAFVELGGLFMHIDAVDSDTLREARDHPERYPHLAVRISGWSARFATLDRHWQDMIIERTEQAL